MTSITIEPCKLKYSLTQGVFVVTHDGEFAAICDSWDILLEWLDGCTRKEVGKVKIFLSAIDDWDKDDVTFLVFHNRQGDHETYESWSEAEGYEDAFMEFWFDEQTSRQYDEEFTRRYRQWNEIHAEPKHEVITSIRVSAPVAHDREVAA